jgi:hypothetical protein
MLPCTPVEDVMKSKIVMVIIGVISAVFLMFLCGFLAVILRYRRMKSQYYEKLGLLKNMNGSGEVGTNSSQIVSDKHLGSKQKRQIIYKIGDDDGGNE